METFVMADEQKSYDRVQPIIVQVSQGPNTLWHSTRELAIMYELSCGYHSNGEKGHVLQCGTHYGGSACALGLGLQDSQTSYNKPAITIDPLRPSDAFPDRHTKHIENIWELGLQEYVCSILHHDIPVLGFWSAPVRICVIDTSHSYEHTKKELELCEPLVVDGGWLVCDDYDTEWGAGVKPAVDEFLAKYNKRQYTLYLDGVMFLCQFTKLTKHNFPRFKL